METMQSRHNVARGRMLVVLALAMLAGGCAAAQRQPAAAPVPEIRPGIPAGYLPAEQLPDPLALIPVPPAAGSSLQALDDDVSRKSLALHGTSRWKLAAEDADLMFPQAAGTFSCALGAPVTERDTPHLYMLLRRSMTDAGLSTYRAKQKYSRVRPFVVNGQPSCTPHEEERLRHDGSYPSGHNAIGWAWALILTEIAPDRANAILARGRAFGRSRIVCNVHWQSDVNEGRMMAASVVARLHADPAFRAELDAARAELQSVRSRGLAPSRDCALESEALAIDSAR